MTTADSRTTGILNRQSTSPNLAVLTIALAIVLCTFTAIPATAQDGCSGDVIALQALYDVRNSMLRGVDSYRITERIEEHMDYLRQPLPGGGYEWVRWVRPSGDGPVVKQEHMVNAEYDADELETFEGSANAPFVVRVVVPRKRSLLKANNEVFVETLTVHYWVEGGEEVLEKEIGQWLKPDTWKSFDLGVIADRATASATVGARAANLGEALVEIHFRQAVAQDDPSGPNYAAIQSLKKLAGYLDARTLDDEIARLEARLFGVSTSFPLTVIVERLREADTLSRSKKTEEQEKGKKLLDDTLSMLR